jgi:transglutaminase-like putative cysteine protease
LGYDDGLDTLIATLETVDHRGVEWARVRRTAYLIHQHLRYEYPGRIADLRQRLMLIPPERHGGQRLITHRLEVSVPGATTRSTRDDFGNLVLEIPADEVEEAVDFTAWIVVERDAMGDPAQLPADDDVVARLLAPSPLTAPDATLRGVARDLAARAGDARTLAERINGWVQTEMRYAPGTTGVRTTAAEALAQRAGVCQDFAHVMLALCRLGGLPARYVSGHLLGEGGTHAWVEALLPDAAYPGHLRALPLDPTHGRAAGLNYITIAVGREYADVAPTSGTFRAPYGGRLSARKRAGLTALDYADA